MNKPYKHIAVNGIICLLVILFHCTETSTQKIERIVQCLLDNTTTEIRIDCGENAVINIKTIQQGFQELPQDTTFCVYQVNDTCGVTEEELYDTVIANCIGSDTCIVPVKKIDLSPCGKTSNYVQVDYQCIQENDPPQNVIDVCGDILGLESIARESGYIETPNYPTNYPPDTSCMCSIRALQPGTRVKLTLLDMTLHSIETDKCVGDWLEYNIPGQLWGRGFRMCNSSLLNDTYIIHDSLELHFRADSEYESRGFWLKYEGKGQFDQPVQVRIQCNQYHPSVGMETGKCLSESDQTEITLDCTDIGVVEVTGVEHWNRIDISECPVITESQENCYHHIEDHPLLEDCMGQTKCIVPVASEPVPTCQAESNYFEVQFQCIPDADEVHNIVDICGDSLNGTSITRKLGFIETPNYPHQFPPSTQCQCHLVTAEPGTTIQLRVLDLELNGKDAPLCKGDWLEHNVDPMLWDLGIKICDGTKRGEVFDTDKSDVYLNFNSDDNNEHRGFWLQYSARNFENNLEAPIRVTCYKWLGGNDKVSDGVVLDSESDDEDNGNDITLIVCISVVIGIMLLLCIAMVLYKLRDSKKKYPPSQPSMIDTPLDKVYNSIKKYSTLHEERGGSVRSNASSQNYSSRQDEYQRSGVSANQLNLPASYMNPVYDGSPVV